MTKGVTLIVGGAGFVGSNLCHGILARCDPKAIWIVDNLLSSDSCNVPDDPRVRFIYGSINDDAILSALPEDIDVVFHLACYHGNQSSIANPLADHENSALTSLKLFDRLKECTRLKKVVYAAAGCAVAEKTFDDAQPTPEDAPVSLYHDSPYSISKILGEMYGNYFFRQYGLPFVKARFQNVYGPREILGAGQWRGTPHTVWRNVVPTFIWKALQGEPLCLDNGGRNSRDFVFVDDIVRGLLACARKGRPGEVYNLASGVETSIGELAEMVNDLTGNHASSIIRSPRKWDRSGRRLGDTSKSEVKLGFRAEVGMREGLKRTVEWTRAHREQISTCISKHACFMRQCHEET
jgi:UDP-glucose 4-epimerase